MAGLGIEHIGEGTDHLLFLFMLLIPAPLAATGGRWRTAPSARRAVGRVVHVVTGFAVHSLTLAVAAAGVIDLPSRPVETLIAFSIAVSAVHAVRPLVARGEVLIASGFGLVHGLAFASLIGDLGLDRGSLVNTLLGFNLGIAVYPAFRIIVALVGLVFSASWMVERATLTSSDPFEDIQTWLVGHPLPVAVTVAAPAVIARRIAPRASSDGHDMLQAR